MGGANSLNGDLRGDSERVTKIPAISPNSTRCCSVQPAPTKPTVGSSNVATCAINTLAQFGRFPYLFPPSQCLIWKNKNSAVLTGPPYYYIACFTPHLDLHPRSPKQRSITSRIIFFILTWRCLLKDPTNAKPMKHCKKCSYSYHLYHAHLTRQSWDSSTFETRSSHQTR